MEFLGSEGYPHSSLCNYALVCRKPRLPSDHQAIDERGAAWSIHELTGGETLSAARQCFRIPEHRQLLVQLFAGAAGAAASTDHQQRVRASIRTRKEVGQSNGTAHEWSVRRVGDFFHLSFQFRPTS